MRYTPHATHARRPARPSTAQHSSICSPSPATSPRSIGKPFARRLPVPHHATLPAAAAPVASTPPAPFRPDAAVAYLYVRKPISLSRGGYSEILLTMGRCHPDARGMAYSGEREPVSCCSPRAANGEVPGTPRAILLHCAIVSPPPDQSVLRSARPACRKPRQENRRRPSACFTGSRVVRRSK